MHTRWLCGLAALGLLGTAAGQDGLPAAVLREVRGPDRLPSARYAAAALWEAEGPELRHIAGRIVHDPQAGVGRAWEASLADAAAASGDAGEAVTRTHRVLYGPYVQIDPGDYLAFFRIKLTDAGMGGRVALVDACVGSGRDVLWRSEVNEADLAAGRYVQVPLGFRYTGGRLECRVHCTGDAGLRVDRVALFRVEGASEDGLHLLAAQPNASGRPAGIAPVEEPRPFADVFPVSAAPARRLVVIDAQRLRRDWQLCLATLQGLVNRTQPRLYCLFGREDRVWLDHMLHRGWVEDTEPAASVPALVRRFRGDVRGMVVTDPALPASKNVATMLAGVHAAVAASPRVAARLGLPVVADLRGRWTTGLAAYRWAFDRLWPKLNHHVVACDWPERVPLRDYLVQHRIFTFWLPGRIDGAKPYCRPGPEVEQVEELLGRMPVNIPAMSYPWAGEDVGIGEGAGVTLLAEFGKYLVGSSHSSNLSVHSGIRVAAFQQRSPAAPALRRDKVYVALIMSDGDNLPVLSNHNFPKLWREPGRGQLPMGWTVSPAACVLIPGIVDYYYSTATAQDCFLAAVSGVGYTYPEAYGKRFREPHPRRAFDGFLDQTRELMARMDLRHIWVMRATTPELFRRYAERIPSLEGIYPDYGRKVMSYGAATFPTARNVAVFRAANGWRKDAPRQEQIAGVVKQLREITPRERPAFLHLFVWNWGFDLAMLQHVLRELGPDYVAVRPDHMATIYRAFTAGEKMLVRAPERVLGVQGHALRFALRVHNCTSGPAHLRVAVSDGLAGAVAQPDSLRLDAGQGAAVTLSGRLSAGRVGLALSGSFGSREQAIPAGLIPADHVVGDLPQGKTLELVHVWEAERLAHRSGQRESDPSAGAQAAWVATPGRAAASHIVFGPYAQTAAGEYVALFRLKRTGPGAGPVAVLDTHCPGAGASASKRLAAGDLPEGQYRWVALAFRHPGGQLETRVYWPGSVPVAVDCVAVWAVSGP